MKDCKFSKYEYILSLKTKYSYLTKPIETTFITLISATDSEDVITLRFNSNFVHSLLRFISIFVAEDNTPTSAVKKVNIDKAYEILMKYSKEALNHMEVNIPLFDIENYIGTAYVTDSLYDGTLVDPVVKFILNFKKDSIKNPYTIPVTTCDFVDDNKG